MRKLVLGLAMVVTMLAMVGCGTSKEEGFAPEQVVENEVVTNDVKEDVEEIAIDDLTQYYDTEKYVGTPYSTVLEIYGPTSRGLEVLQYSADGTRLWEYYIEPNEALQMWKHYNAILCDNNTPDDLTDDVVVYIFTTPIEE
jgi:hypothetical protein